MWDENRTAGSRAGLSLVHDGDPSHQAGRQPVVISFDRRELSLILGAYGRKVAAAEWRDYAMDFLRDRAVFSIFARSSERPLYIIEKAPRLRTRQGQYMVSDKSGRILRRGHDLAAVLRVIDPQLNLVR